MYAIRIEVEGRREVVFACTDSTVFRDYAKKFASDPTATFWLNEKPLRMQP